MRIAFLHDRYPFGGGEKVTADIIRGLALTAPDAHVTVIANHIDTDRTDRTSDRSAYTELPEGTNLRHDDGIAILTGILRSARIDVLIMPVDPPVRMLHAIRATLPECRLVFHLHGVPLWQVINKTARSRVKRLREQLLHSYTRRYIRRYREIYAAVDSFVVLCDEYRSVVERIVGLAPGDRASKVVSIYNPLDTEAYAAAAATPKHRELLYMGRLSHADKRVDRLLRIWQRIYPGHPDWTLKIVGDGPERQNLELMAKQMGLQRVQFCGATTEPATHYATASILCLTSSTEGWGLVLAEALASGVIPIAFDCSAGVHEILADGRGYAIPPFDETAYTTVLGELMDNPEARAAAVNRARQFICSLSVADTGRHWLNLINRITQSS